MCVASQSLDLAQIYSKSFCHMLQQLKHVLALGENTGRFHLRGIGSKTSSTIPVCGHAKTMPQMQCM